MSERCSLADELKDEAEDGGEERQEPVLGGSDTVPESAEAEPPRAELADETYNGVDSAETICDTDVVLLDNDPLLQYLRDKKLPQPSHTVSAPARAADVRACDAGSADEWSRVSKPVDATHRWLVRWWHQTLHTLLSVICPCLLAVLPYGALPISWQAGEWDCADASRLHIHRQCQQQQQSSSSVYTDPLPHPPQRAAAVTLRLSLHLHAACLALALLATLITVGRAILGTPSTIVELACYILLVAFCASNWTIAQNRFRLFERWQSSTASFVSLSSLDVAWSRLVYRLIRRLSEVELVARGYLLSDNLAPATRLDQTQPQNRQSTHIRRTLQRVLAAAMHDHEEAQLSLLAGHRQPCSTASGSLEVDALSIGELKEEVEQLSQMRSTTLSLLLRLSAVPCSLPVASMMDEVLSSLLVSTRQRCQLLDNAMDMWRPHSRTDGTPQLPSLPAPSKDRIASSSLSLRQLSYQLRSAEVRASVAWEQSQLEAGVPLTAHLDYIQRAVQDVQRLCNELTQQHTPDGQPAPSTALVHPLPAAEQQPTTCDSDEQSTLISELRRARRRGQLADGRGAVFEGEGQWGDDASDDGSEAEERAGQRLERRRRLADKEVGTARPVASVSPFAVNLSMLRELKSVLSHRPVVHFASIQADGDGAEMFDDK